MRRINFSFILLINLIALPLVHADSTNVRPLAAQPQQFVVTTSLSPVKNVGSNIADGSYQAMICPAGYSVSNISYSQSYYYRAQFNAWVASSNVLTNGYQSFTPSAITCVKIENTWQNAPSS